VQYIALFSVILEIFFFSIGGNNRGYAQLAHLRVAFTVEMHTPQLRAKHLLNPR
jgi:hypothetical protein